MGKLLWRPSKEWLKHANITQFINFVNEKYKQKISSYSQLYSWSIENIQDFWATMWDFGGIISSQSYTKVVDNLNTFFDLKWFDGARLNFAENLLKFKDDHIAFIFKGEMQTRSVLTYAELNNQVSRLAKTLREFGVVSGDNVAAYMPNLIETVVAMLAATSIGTTWAACGAELGPTAVLNRLGQIKPKILFAGDGYFYKGRAFPTLKNVEEVVRGLPSVEKVIIASYVEKRPEINDIPNSIYFKDFLSSDEHPKMQFEQLPFTHPGYIMFSSGTTGKPKCMVQSTGGVLITQLRDTVLHTDLKRDDVITYITSPSWMMWNWLVSCLATGATIVLYDGNPLYPDWGAMWRLIQEEKITIFGTSASYLHYLSGLGVQPRKDFDLSSLRIISQTASPISSEVNEWLYKEIKKDLHFNSITGGSDINAIFAGGCAILPVYAGQIQVRALGMKIEAYDEAGNPVRDQQAELVCETPSPSMPLYFWDDPDNKRYKQAYFDFYQPAGKNVWRHGDFCALHSETGGLTMYGRSDAILKPSGVRIGTSEIYNVVEAFHEITDSLAIGQNWKGDQRVILFVKLTPGFKLTEELTNRIRKVLREKTSPRHVPAIILETPDIPYTFSMKKVEIAVTNILHGKPVTNRGALSNPESLDYFEKIRSNLS
ncbi:MAG: acetoacetate--CoA ligase [Promethearchaeota archaeon]